MTFNASYESLLYALYSSVVTVVSNTVIGGKHKIEEYPICFIVPKIIAPIAPMGVGSAVHEHQASFEVTTLQRDENTTSGIISSIRMAGDIYDVLRSNETLSGACRVVFYGSFNPDFVTDYALHWCTLTVNAKMIY